MAETGIIHVHSKFSYDGKHTLEEIRSLAKKRRYGFVGITEHSDTFEKNKMSQLVEECRCLSDPILILIPGIEFTCNDNLHLLGLGIRHFTDRKDPISVARFIRAQGGVAIVSHPIRYNYRLPPGLETEIDGIEVWNAAYDGRFIPNDRSIALWQNLRKHNSILRPFAGQDLHQISDDCHVQITIPCNELNEAKLLGSLKAGDYKLANPYFRISPPELSSWLKLHSISWTRKVYLQAKTMRNRLVK